MHAGQSECGRTCKGGGEGADFCRHGKPVDEGSLVGHQDLWLHSRHAASTEHIDRQDNDRGRRRRLYQHPHRPGSEARAHGRVRLARTHTRSLARALARNKSTHTAHTHTRARLGARCLPCRHVSLVLQAEARAAIVKDHWLTLAVLDTSAYPSPPAYAVLPLPDSLCLHKRVVYYSKLLLFMFRGRSSQRT